MKALNAGGATSPQSFVVGVAAGAAWMLAVACAATAPTTADPVHPGDARLPAGPELAVVVTEGALVAVPMDGGAPIVLASLPPGEVVDADAVGNGEFEWCVADPALGGVWYTRVFPDDVDGKRDLLFVGLSASGAPGTPTLIASGLPELDLVVIDHGDAGRLGDREPVSFRLGLEVRLGAQPKLGPLLGCDGDQAWYCYEGEALDELQPELEERQSALGRLALAEPGVLLGLAARGRGRALEPATTPTAPPPPDAPLAVPADGCEEEGCGEVEVVRGAAWWLVITSSSRGDFYHATRHLYDPDARAFFRPWVQGERTPAPHAEGAITSFWISSSGRGYTDLEGHVVDFARGSIYDDAHMGCGFVTGGWFNGRWPFY